MAWTEEQINLIYDRTSGYCHICHKKLSFRNYASCGERGAWEIDHSVARARLGTERMSNLYAACIACNRSKQHRTSKVARYAVGTRRAPVNRPARIKKKREQAVAGGYIGAVLGGALFGPPGAVLGAVVGGHLGHRRNPDKL